MRTRKLAVLAAVMAGPFATATIAESAVAAEKSLTSSMSGRKEVPKRGDANGRGTARITTDMARQRICFRITLKRVGTVNAGHIHPGKRGVANPPVVALFSKATRRPRGCVRNVDRAMIRRIQRNPGKFYVNVHNKRHPDGAVRGQLKERGNSY